MQSVQQHDIDFGHSSSLRLQVVVSRIDVDEHRTAIILINHRETQSFDPSPHLTGRHSS
jgi:hypothetical protein